MVGAVISGGVLVASYGEIQFDLVGLVYQVGSVISEALRLVLTQILLQRKGIKMDPITIMYYMSPCRSEPHPALHWGARLRLLPCLDSV